RQAQVLGEPLNDVSQVFECVGELLWRRGVAVPESRVVGRDHAELPGDQLDEPPEHEGGRREAVQEEERGPGGIAGLAVADLNAVDLDLTVVRGHGWLPCRWTVWLAG